LFERVGDTDFQALLGEYRVVAGGGAPIFKAGGSDTGRRLKEGEEFSVGQVSLVGDTIVGSLVDQEVALLFAPSQGIVAELIVEGYNTKPRKAIKGQTGHQMMLVSDMVLLWDEGFRQHLQAYADDEELLRNDFAAAFKRLTELGCPWSKDRLAGTNCKAGTAFGVGCPFLSAQQSK